MRKFSLFALLLGLGLTAYLLHRIGLGQLLDYARSIGWSYVVLIPLSFIWILPNTQGFACAINPKQTSVSFVKLMMTRLVGESVNYLTPSGYLGGEPVKATLLASTLGVGNATGVVVVAKTAQTLALLIFISVGVLLANWTLSLTAAARTSAIGAIILLSLGVFAMVLISRKYFLSRIMNWASARFESANWFKKLQGFAGNTDHSLFVYYQENKGRFFASVLWHFIGWSMGTFEVMMIVHLLGLEISILNAFLLSSIATIFMVGGFMIPGSLGAFELGHYVASSMVGLPPEIGLAICFARRLREVIWLGIGLALFGFFYKNVRNLFKTSLQKGPSGKGVPEQNSSLKIGQRKSRHRIKSLQIQSPNQIDSSRK